LKAWLNLRLSLPERVAAFAAGLRRHGYAIEHGVTREPGAGDVLVTWNRIGVGEEAARWFEARGNTVLVTENATWGNGFAGDRWLTLARNRHNTAGRFPVGGAERWDSLGIEPAPWRSEGETVILAQRGIGSPPVAMPRDWPDSAYRRFGGRVRRHPGRTPGKPLAEDLAQCGRVVTWGSGAAVQALMCGIPVMSEMPDWIAAQDNTDAGRLAMLRRLAWGQARMSEIESGEAMERLLCES
jgi:hypothetical protein